MRACGGVQYNNNKERNEQSETNKGDHNSVLSLQPRGPSQ